jgi:hypothetical protein
MQRWQLRTDGRSPSAIASNDNACKELEETLGVGKVHLG